MGSHARPGKRPTGRGERLAALSECLYQLLVGGEALDTVLGLEPAAREALRSRPSREGILPVEQDRGGTVEGDWLRSGIGTNGLKCEDDPVSTRKELP